ncbi:MAG: hypothetical protein ACKVRP_07650 [Bacteroidota bacterium]
MARLDIILTIVFSTLALGGLAVAILCFRKAMKVSGQKDGDLKMFVWAAIALLGLVIAGMSAAYILLPILFFHT